MPIYFIGSSHGWFALVLKCIFIFLVVQSRLLASSFFCCYIFLESLSKGLDNPCSSLFFCPSNFDIIVCGNLDFSSDKNWLCSIFSLSDCNVLTSTLRVKSFTVQSFTVKSFATKSFTVPSKYALKWQCFVQCYWNTRKLDIVGIYHDLLLIISFFY